MHVEHKGLSVTLHYREHPEAGRTRCGRGPERPGRPVRPRGATGADVRRAAPAGRHRQGHRGRRSWPAGCAAVCFLGDDVGDLPAFAALDRLAGRGSLGGEGRGRSSELAPELAGRRRRHRRRAGRGARRCCRARRPTAGPAAPRRPRRRASAGGGELVGQPVRRGAGRGPAPQPSAASVARSSAGMRQGVGAGRRPCRRRRRGRPAGRAPTSWSHDAGLGREQQDRVALVHQRTLLGHQVEAVADRVDQQHVGPAQRGHRAREVVGGSNTIGVQPGGAPTAR